VLASYQVYHVYLDMRYVLIHRCLQILKYQKQTGPRFLVPEYKSVVSTFVSLECTPHLSIICKLSFQSHKGQSVYMYDCKTEFLFVVRSIYYLLWVWWDLVLDPYICCKKCTSKENHMRCNMGVLHAGKCTKSKIERLKAEFHPIKINLVQTWDMTTSSTCLTNEWWGSIQIQTRCTELDIAMGRDLTATCC